MKLTKNVSLGLAMAFALAANSAQADTISGGSFSNALQTTEINQSGSLALFDSNLGILTGVTLTLSGAAQTQITLTNNAAQAQNVTATGTVDVNFGSSLAALNAQLAGLNPLVLLSLSTGLQNIASGGTYTSPVLNDSDNFLVINPPPIAQFAQAGGGFFTISCDSASGISLKGGGGNVVSTQATTAGCGASIEYEYTKRQVPEPGTMALLGLGVLGLGVARRRFNS